MATTEQRWVAGFGWDDQFIVGTVTVKVTEKQCVISDWSSDEIKEVTHYKRKFPLGSFHRTKDEAIAALIQTFQESAANAHEEYQALMKQVSFLKGLSDGRTAT